ncbi:MAG: lipid-binding SYLF domain-containing protein [Thermodesulfobacteriota bacterium]
MRVLTVVGMVVVLLGLWLSGVEAGSVEDANTQIRLSDLVLSDALKMPDRGVPRDLLQRSRGVLIFPGVLKAGLVLGITYGSGVGLRRDEGTGKWSKPAFFQIKGGSLGVQAGAQAVDLILLVMSERGLQGLLEDGYTLGADVSIAAGPIGREASAGTDLRFNAGILSYSRTKGLFVGLSLNGAALKPDRDANEAYHGKGVTVQDVFYENKGALSDNGRLLLKTIDEATP